MSNEATSPHSQFCSSCTLRTSSCKIHVVDLSPFLEWENWQYKQTTLAGSHMPLIKRCPNLKLNSKAMLWSSKWPLHTQQTGMSGPVLHWCILVFIINSHFVVSDTSVLNNSTVIQTTQAKQTLHTMHRRSWMQASQLSATRSLQGARSEAHRLQK